MEEDCLEEPHINNTKHSRHFDFVGSDSLEATEHHTCPCPTKLAILDRAFLNRISIPHRQRHVSNHTRNECLSTTISATSQTTSPSSYG
eukprot:scaffold10861_cov180-Amphora_coffeaeformis.AAC.16